MTNDARTDHPARPKDHAGQAEDSWGKGRELRRDPSTSHGNRGGKRVLRAPTVDLEGVPIPSPPRSLRSFCPTRRCRSCALSRPLGATGSQPASKNSRRIRSAASKSRHKELRAPPRCDVLSVAGRKLPRRLRGGGTPSQSHRNLSPCPRVPVARVATPGFYSVLPETHWFTRRPDGSGAIARFRPPRSRRPQTASRFLGALAGSPRRGTRRGRPAPNTGIRRRGRGRGK